MNLPVSIRLPLAILLVTHGAIHVLGFLWAFDLAEIVELGGPTFLINGGAPGDATVIAFGLVWLLVMAAFMTAGIGVALNKPWSLALAGVAAGISLVPTIVWWTDAWIGALLSIAILGFAFIASQSRAHNEPFADNREGVRI